VTAAGHRPSTEPGLTADDVRAPTHAERARTLVGSQRTGTLATLTEEGFPYGSYITFALDGADPVFLVSTMAAHTKNLERDDRASLLVHEDGATDPLSNGRVTLVGRCTRLTDAAAAREAFLAIHPQASYYVDFTDFGFFKLAVDAVRYIGGYGRMSWVELDGWQAAETDPIAAGAAAIIDHMNADHADALVAYARAFSRATETQDAVMVGVDRYGFELSVETEKGRRPARIAFADPIATSGDARKAMIDLLQVAREKLGES
jgi:putative heme iron utilization protein